MFEFKKDEETGKMFIRFGCNRHGRNRRVFEDELDHRNVSALLKDAFRQGVLSNQRSMWDVLGIGVDDGNLVEML